MRITSPKLDSPYTTVNEEALLRCQAALECKDKGDYAGARDVMRRLWKGVGERPIIKPLHPSVAAEVFLCVGILTSWIGSKEGIESAQESAKNLISESIHLYELAGDTKKVAEARAEIAYCYWREGGYDEARILLTEALQKLTAGNTRARALLKLTTVEWSAARYDVALQILNDNAHLFARISNHTTRGNYHNELAIVLRNLATGQKTENYFGRAIREYEEADRHFKLARNVIYQADVKNNLGFLLYKMSRFKKSHQYLDQARRLTVSLKDKVGIAQIDETRAQVLLAQHKFKQAEAVAAGAVRILEKSGHQCLLADALTTHAIALARLKQTERAQFTFQKAIEVAFQVGALNKAGLAALTLIEELDDLPPQTLSAAYDRASEWLATSQSQDLLLRLNAASRKVFGKLRAEMSPEDATEAIMNKPRDLQGEVLKHEENLIREALAKANGSVTRAAAFLSMSYQALAYVIESRHQNLLKERSPIRRRTRKDQEQKKPLNT